jgi:L-proline amide hydrolase
MTETFMTWEAGKTYYKVIGDLKSKLTPVVLLHGGPGFSHDYLLPPARLINSTGRPVILYDQIGCGKSTHKPKAKPNYWTVDLFLEELSLLIKHLGIGNNYSVMGQSWGGMLAMEHAVLKPKGLKSLVLANTLPSSQMWSKETRKLVNKLPIKIRKTIEKHEKSGTFESPEFQSAMMAFYDRHVCKIPFPQELTDSFAAYESDPTVYSKMWGPSEFTINGTLKDWTIVKRLNRIEVKSLVISGSDDEATPAMQKILVDGIKRSKQVLIKGASHCAAMEHPLEWMQAVNAFLAKAEK